MKWVQFLKHKLESFDMFKSFKSIAENQIGKRIKYLISDRGGEFISKEFDEYCGKYDIII